MYQGYRQGYAGMHGVPQGAVPNSGGNTTSSTQSVSDLFAQLQRQIPGFENIPVPRALTEQRMVQQAAQQPFKGVSRSNLFVQCINRDGVEHGLRTDEQANIPSMNIFGINRAERSFKDFDVDLFSDVLDYEPKEVKQPVLEEKKPNPSQNVSPSPGTSIPTIAGVGSHRGYVSQPPGHLHQSVPLKPPGHLHQSVPLIPPGHLYQSVPLKPPGHLHQSVPLIPPGHLHQSVPLIPPGHHPSVPQKNPVNQWQAHLMEYGSHDDHEQQDQQNLHGHSTSSRTYQSSPANGNDKRSQSLSGRSDSDKRDDNRRDERDSRYDRREERRDSRRSPDRRRRSPERNRRSPERNRRSPERNRSSNRNDSSRSRRDRSPIRDSSRWSRNDRSPDREQRRSRDSRGSSPHVFTRAPSNPSLKGLKDVKQLKTEYESFIKGIEDDSGFKKPLPPPVGSIPPPLMESTRKSKFSKNYSEIPPPTVYDPKRGSKHNKTKSTSKRNETRKSKSPESDDEDFVKQLSQGPKELIKKQPPKRHEILLNMHSGPSENRPNLSQYGTAHVQSHYENERARLAIALASGKPAKDVQSNIEDPRKPIIGAEISKFIANFIGTVGKSKKGVQIVAKKYHLPGNCIGLIPPKMTHEVWDILKKPTQIRDDTLQDVQRWVSLGVIPVVHQIDLFGMGAQEAKDVCRVTSDSLTVLGYVLMNMSIKRRLLMRSSLNKKYAALCRTFNNVTSLLFGDNLAKDLIEIKFGTYRVEKSKEEDNDDMLSPNYKPTFFAGLAVPGSDVDVNVASMINMACANDGDVEDLKEKYNIPSNCSILIPAKINPEMWSLLSRSGLELDYKLQNVQLSIAEATVPLMKLLESVHQKRYNPCEALGMLTEALALLGNSVYQMNKVRMEAMMKTLPESVHQFGHWYWPGAEQVSGENLEEELQVCENTNADRRAGLILGVMQSQRIQL